MNLTSMCKTTAVALVISSGATTAPAAAQSAGDGVEMERIVIAMPNGKRIIRYVPRTTKTGGDNGGSGNNDSPGVRPPNNDGGSGDGDGGFSPAQTIDAGLPGVWGPPDGGRVGIASSHMDGDFYPDVVSVSPLCEKLELTVRSQDHYFDSNIHH